jgi:hypothetical protein
MSNQAMTKLAAEFYERGRQAALIDAGLIKVANKSFNKGFYGSLLGLSAAQLALAKLLGGAPKKALVPLLKGRSAPVAKSIPVRVVDSAPIARRGVNRVEDVLNVSAGRAGPAAEVVNPRLVAATQMAKEKGTHILDELINASR